MNGTPQRLLRPGTCQHTLTNLEPDQEYKVHVRTKNRRRAPDQAQEEDIDCDPLAASVLFRTEPGGIVTTRVDQGGVGVGEGSATTPQKYALSSPSRLLAVKTEPQKNIFSLDTCRLFVNTFLAT